MKRLLALLCALCLIGCARPATTARAPLSVARRAHGTGDGEALGGWLLAELIAPGGTAANAKRARAELDALGGKGSFRGLRAAMARGIDADLHGRLPEAAAAYLDAVVAARTSDRPEAALYAWFAARRLQGLRSAVSGFDRTAAPAVRRSIEDPGAIGWFARASLVDWLAQEAGARARAEELAREQGCLSAASFAGPFGDGGPGDHRVHFSAERAAPWPAEFAPEEDGHRPSVFSAERNGCRLSSARKRPEGIYYAQSFIDLDEPRDLIVSVAGAFSLLVDDRPVLSRDAADWGSWPRLGVQLSLGAGRHRILARLGQPETSVRVLLPDGRPLYPTAEAGSADDALPYALAAPVVLADPSPLEPFLRAIGAAPSSAPRASDIDPADPAARFCAAWLAADGGYRDIADVLMQPLSEADKATPVALAQAAEFTEGDPIFSRQDAHAMARDLYSRAAEGDDGLWAPALWLALDRTGQARPAEIANSLEELSKRFVAVPAMGWQLARIDAQLGWTVEQTEALRALARRFPDDVPTLEALVEVAERQGRKDEVDRLVGRILQLDPSNEIALRRALLRRDYEGAIAALRNAAAAEGEGPSLSPRVADLRARASGAQDRSAALAQLLLAVKDNPKSGAARLALADARFAGGDRRALSDALSDAVKSGARTEPLRKAIELVEGATALEPYRKDGLAIIRDAEKKGIELPGIAARILDYAALWIDPSGSARMLEHTILRVQSKEGIEAQAEQRLPLGTILTLRTIKKDGRIFEPELVAGKPTVTMPHLEIGDYLETESIWSIPGDGRSFRSPRWYFREPNVSYHLSQLVVISPKSRPLVIETHGQVPAPEVQDSAGLVVRRWTVTGSLALPEEPDAPPIDEFLPSVQVGWAESAMAQLERIADARAGGYPADPRLVRIARAIATGKIDGKLAQVPPSVRARRIYRWVVDNVHPGPDPSKEEHWPARIVTGKSGDLTEAFMVLCRLVGVDARLGAIKSRLSSPDRGPLSEIDAFDATAVRVQTEKGPRWLVVRLRFAPYGFLPSFLAGEEAVLLDREEPLTAPGHPPLERERTSAESAQDGVVHRGKVAIRADGSAAITLDEELSGRYAIIVRTALSEVEAVGAEAERKQRELIEQRMIASKLPGARVQKLTLKNLDELDEPLRMTLAIEVPNFAHATSEGLAFDAPFLGRMAPMVELPARQTPLYVADSARSRVMLDVELPAGGKLASVLEAAKFDDPRLQVHVADGLHGAFIHLDREVHLPAGRVQPGDYPAFRELVLSADRALNQPVRIELK